MPKYVIAEINFYDNELTQRIVDSELNLEELYNATLSHAIGVPTEGLSIEKVKMDFFNMDAMISIIEVV